MIILLWALSFYSNANAFQIDQKLTNPVQEKAAQELFKDIRCVVCEGESLAESDADMAFDMRSLIRKEIISGKAPAQIKAELVENYGERILQMPPMATKTYFLWFVPFVMLIIGLICLSLQKPKKKA